MSAQILPDARVGVRPRGVDRQLPEGRQPRVELDAADARIGAVMHLGEAVLTQERELEVLPFLLIDRAVEPQLLAEEGRLEPDLVVGEVIGRVGRDRAAP